jgi:heme exporter protein B
MSFLRKVWAIVWKDLLIELRTKEMLSSSFVLALLLVVIFHVSFDLRVDNMVAVAPAVLWVTLVFAGTLELNRSLAAEIEESRMDGLLLAPMERSAIYLGKVAGNLLFMTAAEAVILPIFSAVFDLNLLQPMLLLTVILGTTGFATVGTLLSTMAANTRAREVMLPVLLFPVLLPVVLSAVRLTAGILERVPGASLAPWLRLLIGFDIIFLVISFLTFDYIVQG